MGIRIVLQGRIICVSKARLNFWFLIQGTGRRLNFAIFVDLVEIIVINQQTKLASILIVLTERLFAWSVNRKCNSGLSLEVVHVNRVPVCLINRNKRDICGNCDKKGTKCLKINHIHPTHIPSDTAVNVGIFLWTCKIPDKTLINEIRIR